MASEKKALSRENSKDKDKKIVHKGVPPIQLPDPVLTDTSSKKALIRKNSKDKDKKNLIRPALGDTIDLIPPKSPSRDTLTQAKKGSKKPFERKKTAEKVEKRPETTTAREEQPPGNIIKNIEEPKNPQHLLHVHVDSTGNIVGLPAEWQRLLTESNVKAEEVSEEIVGILRTSTRAAREIKKLDDKDLNIWDFVAMGVDPTLLFEYQSILGEGFEGEVHLCLEKSTKQQVAIKKSEINEKKEQLLASEIYVLKTTKHKNVVEFKGCYFVHPCYIWIVMEFMDGGTLSDIIDKYPQMALTEPQIKWVIWSVSKGLNFLHQSERIHRDIKSPNILLKSNGEVKIGDFGFAAQLTPDNKNRRTVLGTPYWMAPEVIEGRKYGKPADIWSLGILLYECCNGGPPYNDMPKLKALMAIVKRGCPMIKQKDPAWSDLLLDFFSGLIRHKQEKRLTIESILEHPWIEKVGLDPNTTRLVPTISAIKQLKTSSVIKPPEGRKLKSQLSTSESEPSPQPAKKNKYLGEGAGSCESGDEKSDAID